MQPAASSRSSSSRAFAAINTVEACYAADAGNARGFASESLRVSNFWPSPCDRSGPCNTFVTIWTRFTGTNGFWIYAFSVIAS
jgi:hypothetical protein